MMCHDKQMNQFNFIQSYSILFNLIQFYSILFDINSENTHNTEQLNIRIRRYD